MEIDEPYDRHDILLKAAEIMASRKEELNQYQREETGPGGYFLNAPST
jgi:hypothetical protein